MEINKIGLTSNEQILGKIEHTPQSKVKDA